MKSLALKAIAACRDLSRMSEEAGRTTRTFLSPPMREVHAYLGSWMKQLGMQVNIDAAGNLRALHGDSARPRLVIASHLDTVPNAGAFDGILGVVLGVTLMEASPRLSVEVAGFSEEEGVRFGTPFIGSQAFVGNTNWENPAITDAIAAFGLNPGELPAARFAPQCKAYLEFHIEQGPVLERLNLPLAVVDAIAGQSRFMVTFEGKANHAGTTPMDLRDDALLRAAQWIVRVNEYARSCPGLVATVGSIAVLPNAVNVIPGEVRASVDIRHPDDAIRRKAASHLLEAAGAKYILLLDQAAVNMDAALSRTLAASVTDAGYPLHKMTSGAGHDAMIVAPHLPAAMLFLRSPRGISHHPDETVLPGDVEAAVETGMAFLKRLEMEYA